jgi:hypothetical protein
MVGLAFLVARPSVEPPAATPYVGVRGASRAKAAGLAITLQRGAELNPLSPGTLLRAGDVLRFAVRGERPRQLVVRARDARGPIVTLFPAGGALSSQLARPGDQLPATLAIGAAAGKVAVTALFADAPFPTDAAPRPETEVVDVVMEKAREAEAGP